MLFENGKGSYYGKSMQNINHAHAMMDQKRAMIKTDRDIIPNGRRMSVKGQLTVVL